MFKVTNDWPSTQYALTVKFVAQCLYEVVGNRTFESFRVSTLDNRSRIREAIHICSDIFHRDVNIETVKPCLSEISEYLRNDNAALSLAEETIELALAEIKSPPSNRKQVAHIGRILKYSLSGIGAGYQSEIENDIISLCSDGKQKEKIRFLCNAYASTLINAGYSKEFIRSKVREKFFSKEIKRVEKRTLTSFFGAFSGAQKKHDVYILVSESLFAYVSMLNTGLIKAVAFADGPESAQKIQKRKTVGSDKVAFVKLTVNTLDPYASLKQALGIVSSIVSITAFAEKGPRFAWENVGFVKASKAENGLVLSLDRINLQRLTKVGNRRQMAELSGQTELMLTRFDQTSTIKILSAANMGALARGSTRPESQLTTLWSAIEVMMGDPPSGTPRIVHYVDQLTPCICIGYVPRYIKSVYNAIQVSHRKYVSDFFRRPEFDQNEDGVSRFIRLLFLRELGELGREFCAGLTSSPLTLYRLWKTQKNFNSPDAYSLSLEKHRLRVEWQLFRIYRTRNQIVHQGSVPSFIDPLVINAFEYLQRSTLSIVKRPAVSHGRLDLDQTISEIGFEFKMLLDRLKTLKGRANFLEEEVFRFHRQ